MTFALARDAKRAAAAALTTRMDEDGVDDVRVPSANDATATIGRVAEIGRRARRDRLDRLTNDHGSRRGRLARRHTRRDLSTSSRPPASVARRRSPRCDGAGATLWFFRGAVADGCKSGRSRSFASSRALVVRSGASSSRDTTPRKCGPSVSPARPGGGRAERLAMAAHHAEHATRRRRLPGERIGERIGNGSTNGSAKASAKASADAAALATWMDEGGVGGAAEGHVAARRGCLSCARVGARRDSRAAEGEIVDDAARAAYRADALRATGRRSESDSPSPARPGPREGVVPTRVTHAPAKIRAWQMCAAAPALDAIEALDEANDEAMRRTSASRRQTPPPTTPTTPRRPVDGRDARSGGARRDGDP